MFERFTSRARHVIVLAQEEARGLQHNYIGTEHILLGLLGEPSEIAARALGSFGISLASAREEVTARIGIGKKPLQGHIPFTPRAKKTLELALREALAMQHNYIGTEHILLGVIREGDGVAAQILAEQAGDLGAVRKAVLDLVPPAQAPRGLRWLRRRGAPPSPGEPGEDEQDELRTTPAADSSLSEAARLAGSGAVGSHHLLLATLADPNTAAARALAALGVDLEQARGALRDADVAGTSDEEPEEAGRRRMLISVTGDRLTIDAADELLLGLARDALRALGDQASPTGTIRGDLPVSVSLGTVWQAIRESLEDIRNRAAAARGPVPRAGRPGRSETGTG